MERALTPKQSAFVQEYLIDMNATQACIRSGYSPKTANKMGTQLLGKTSIKKAIQMAKEERSKRLERTADDILLDVYQVGLEARSCGQHSVALKALETEAKFLGLFDTEARNQEQALAKVDAFLGTFEFGF